MSDMFDEADIAIAIDEKERRAAMRQTKLEQYRSPEGGLLYTLYLSDHDLQRLKLSRVQRAAIDELNADARISERLIALSLLVRMMEKADAQ